MRRASSSLVDYRQTGRSQNQRGRATGRIGGAGDGSAAVRLFQGRRVVDAISGHRDQMAARLQRFDDSVLVLREDTGETIRSLDGVCNRGRYVVGIHVFWKGIGSRYDVSAHAELARGLDRDSGVIAGHHFDPHTFVIRHVDSRLGIVARRIEHWQNAEQRPGVRRVFRASNTQRPRAFGRELIDGLLDLLYDISRRLGEVDDHLGRTLGNDNTFSLAISDRRLGALTYGIEGHEFYQLEGFKRILILQRRDYRGVDSVT